METGNLECRAVGVVGASGFVGHALIRHVADRGVPVVSLSRQLIEPPAGVTAIRVADYSSVAPCALQACDAVIYLAARAHMLADHAVDPQAAFDAANCDTPLRFVEAAASAGVRRIVYVSSIGVNGAKTQDRPFRATDVPAPHSPYARSKARAENALRSRCDDLGLELAVVRPPLIYGPGAPGNFARLRSLVDKGLPIPLGGIRNRRSLVGIDNLCDFLLLLCRHEAAAGQTFLVSDGCDVSTTDLIRHMVKESGSRSRVIAVPASALHLLLSAIGKRGMATQLLDSLQIDLSPTIDTLGWRPPLTTAEGIGRCFRGRQ